MSWEACLADNLESARGKGYEAFRRGDIVKPAPDPEKYRTVRYPFALQSANRYHTAWVEGWEKARDEA